MHFQRGLLIQGEGGLCSAGQDGLPAQQMGQLGRHGFLEVCDESTALAQWPQGPFDLVLIAPGCRRAQELLDRCGSGLSLVVVGTPGSSELDAALEGLRERGVPFLGPGSQGFFSWPHRLCFCWSKAVGPPEPDGHVALISQGGTVGFSLYAMAAEAGVRFRGALSLGSPPDDATLLAALERAIDDPQVHLLVLCLETLQQGRQFLQMASRAAARRLPLLLLRVGRWPELKDRVLQRHRDGAWTDDVMWNSVARQFGVTVLEDAHQIVDVGKLFSSPWRAQGDRVAVAATSEGLAFALADRCLAARLRLVQFSPALTQKLEHQLPPWGSTQNPLDLSKGVLEDPLRLSRILMDLQKAPEVDLILVGAGSMTPKQGRDFAEAVSLAHQMGPKPVAACCLSRWKPLEEMVARLNAAGVPLFSSPRRVADALGGLWDMDRPHRPPAASCPVGKQPLMDSLPEKLSERDAFALVDHYGLAAVEQRFCRTMAEALEASRELGFPLALKAVSPSFASKQKVRALALNLRSEEQLRNSYGRVLERAHRAHPDAEIQGVLVQRMAQGVECMIGIKRDPLFGPMVAVALGGAYYELMKDLVLRAAPVTQEIALEMVQNLRGYPLLSGQWGQRLDVQGLAEQIVKLSRMGWAEPDLEVLDLNPIFVGPQGVAIADAFAVRRRGH